MSEVQAPESTQLQEYYGEAISTSALVLQGDSLDRMMKLADIMAKGSATMPKHLAGNSSDCLAVVMQAMQWGMNPFAVAQKTHMTQGGTLGYEAQLVNAVVVSRAPVIGRPEYEYLGDWDKILGKVEERKSDKGGKYYVATWKKEDEQGLGIIVRLTLKGEEAPREVRIMMSQAYPRFSTQWATDPQQQISYLAIRKWARRYTPDVILGVYTNDELEPERGEIDITPGASKAAHQKPADVGAAAVPQGNSSDATTELYDRLQKIAKTEGIEGYEKAWKALKPAERGAIGVTRHNELKSAATVIDADFTEVQQDGAGVEGGDQ